MIFRFVVIEEMKVIYLETPAKENQVGFDS